MNYVFYVADIETTGLDSHLHDVIELSLHRLGDTSENAQRTWCIKPLTPDTIDPDALRINGHKLDDLLHKTKEGRDLYLEADKALVEIENWLSDDMVPAEKRFLIGQNIGFDKERLDQLWVKCNSKDAFPFGRRLMDTMMNELFIDFCRGQFAEGYSLKNLVKKYGVKNDKGEFKVTHVVRNDQLKPITQSNYDTKTGRYEHKPQEISSKEFGDWKNKFQGKYEKSIAQTKSSDIDKKPADGDVLTATYKQTQKLRTQLLASNTAKYKNITKNKANVAVLDSLAKDINDVHNHIYNGPSQDRHVERTNTWKIRTLDKLFKDENLKADVDYSTYTGTSAKLEKDKTFTFKGYASSSLNPAKITTDGNATPVKGEVSAVKPSLLQIDIKKGQSVLDVNAAYHAAGKPDDNRNADEDEHILPRNTKLKIVDGPVSTPKGMVWRAEIHHDEKA